MGSIVVPEEVKKEIRSILLSKIGGVRLGDFQKDFTRLIGHPLNLKALKLTKLSSLIEAIPDVAVIARSEKDGQNYIRGVKDPGMFMNCTASKAQYKPKPGSSVVAKPTARKMKIVPVDMSSEVVQEWMERIVPNRKDLYALCCDKAGMTYEDMDIIFSDFGEVVEVSFSAKFAFVRFRTKEEVLQALWSLQDSDMQVFIPDEKGGSPTKTPFAALRNSPVKTPRTFVAKATPEQKISVTSSQAHLSQIDKNTVDLFVGNLPPGTTENQIAAHFEEFNIVNIRLRSKDGKLFAFVRVSSADAKELEQKYNQSKLGGSSIIVSVAKSQAKSPQISPSDSAATYDSPPRQTYAQYDVPDLESEHALPELESEFPLPDYMKSKHPGLAQQIPDLEYEQQLPDLEYELPYLEQQLPDLEYELPLPDLEDGLDYENGWNRNSQQKAKYFYANESNRKRPEVPKLFVSHFPYVMSEFDLYQLFAPYGATVVYMKNNTNFQRPSSALVGFASEEDRDYAFMDAYGTYLGDQQLIINIAYSPHPPQEEFDMRLQLQAGGIPPLEEGIPPLQEEDFHEHFVVTVPSTSDGAHRRVQKVDRFQGHYAQPSHVANGGVPQRTSYHQNTPRMPTPNGAGPRPRYYAEPPPLEDNRSRIHHQMAALSVHMSNGFAGPPPRENMMQQYY